jgi:hypothetical protein
MIVGAKCCHRRKQRNNTIARHIFSAETESDGKASFARVGVLQVWLKQDGRWKLLARQAYSLPT